MRREIQNKQKKIDNDGKLGRLYTKDNKNITNNNKNK